MDKVLFFVLFVASLSILLSSQESSAVSEIVFEEDFDGILTGWIESVCNTAGPINQIEQICRIDQTTNLFDPPNEPPNSLPNWGFVEIEDTGLNVGSATTPIEVRYQKSFNVVTEDDYDVSVWLGIRDCQGCNISTQLYIDGILIFEKIGPDIQQVPAGPHKFFEQSIVHLTSGTHNVEMAMHSTGALFGNFRASFDDIMIQRESPTQVIGGEIIPIETTSLILAGAQSTSWITPIVVVVLGIGLVVVRRK